VYFFLSTTLAENRKNNNENSGTILEELSEETGDLEINTNVRIDKKEDIQETSSLDKARPKFLWSDIFQAVTHLSHVSWSIYWDVFTLKFLLGFAQAVHYQNFSLILKEEYGIAPSGVGYMISFQGLVGATAGFLTGWIDKFYKKDKDHTLRTFHGFGTLTLSCILLSLVPNLTFFLICLVPLSASSSLLRIVTTQVILQRTEPDQRGSLIGSGQSMSSVARLIAPLCSGLAYDMFGFHGTSVLRIAVTAVAMALSSVLSIQWGKSKAM
jgi:predicted MFS family arabinose efflux permease